MANTKIPSELSSTPSISDGGNATAITIDSSELIGVNTSSPQKRLHILGQDGSTGLTEGNSRTQLFLENNQGCYINIASANNNKGGIFFSDADANNQGAVRYNHLDDTLTFDTANSERMRINSSGHVGIGTTSPTTAKVVIAHDNSTIALHTTGAYNYQAKFESTDAEAGIVLADVNSTGNYNRIGVVTNDMTFITNNSERMRIDSSGNITKPGHPVFDVSTTATGLSGVITYNTVYTNVGSHYSTSNGRFTAPIAGTYMFTTQYIKNGTSGVCRRNFKLNGGSTGMMGGRQLRMDSGGNYGDNGTMIIIVTLAANDYVQVNQYAGSSHGGTAYEQFSGFLIG